MAPAPFPLWSLAPFLVLLGAIATLPVLLPHVWEKKSLQCLVVAACAAPIIAYCLLTGRDRTIEHALLAYATFLTTLGALYVTAGGVHITGNLEATPRTNLAFVLVGALLASVIGTTGASMLLIRPFLTTNRERTQRGHIVVFFILVVANAGGLLTPLGDPPLLVGYIQGVPFFWTLRLLPIWLLYVGSLSALFFRLDRRAYAREPAAARQADRANIVPIKVLGVRNVMFLILVVPALFLPPGFREAAMVALAIVSYAATPRTLYQENRFSFGPIIEVAILFAGIFLCLGPVEASLTRAAPSLPFTESWHFFWGSGIVSAFLDNAPTYSAFAALARGQSAGASGLVAGIAPLKLAAISIGSVVMGATTYIGNGPNLMVRAIAQYDRFPVPSFFRYALFAFAVMLPMHLLTTVLLVLLEK